MTIEDFRAKMDKDFNADELKAGFERRIAEIANKTIDERDDFNKMKRRISDLESIVEKLQSVINSNATTAQEKEAQ